MDVLRAGSAVRRQFRDNALVTFWRGVVAATACAAVVLSAVLIGWGVAHRYHDIEQGYAFGAGIACLAIAAVLGFAMLRTRHRDL